MYNKKLKSIIPVFTAWILLFALNPALEGQSAILSSGGNAAGSNGSASFSAGQVAYITASGTTGTAAAGVQQPYEISIPTGIELPEITLSWIVYPNPVGDILILKTGGSDQDNLSFKLLDMSGRLLKEEKILSPETDISFSGISPGTYFLKVFTKAGEIKVFKIVKH